MKFKNISLLVIVLLSLGLHVNADIKQPSREPVEMLLEFSDISRHPEKLKGFEKVEALILEVDQTSSHLKMADKDRYLTVMIQDLLRITNFLPGDLQKLNENVYTSQPVISGIKRFSLEFAFWYSTRDRLPVVAPRTLEEARTLVIDKLTKSERQASYCVALLYPFRVEIARRLADPAKEVQDSPEWRQALVTFGQVFNFHIAWKMP